MSKTVAQILHPDFFHQPVGLTSEQIQALLPEQELHVWTQQGCIVLHVLGRPFLEKERWKATAAHDKLSYTVIATKTQFHLPGDQCR